MRESCPNFVHQACAKADLLKSGMIGTLCVAVTLVGEPHLSSKSSHIDYIKVDISSWTATADLHMIISFSLF
jgi:hypothetical protein